MKNSANLNNWFLMKYPVPFIFIPFKLPTEYLLYKYFALPTDTPVCLFGNTYNDTRADEVTTEFTDGHRIITGSLINFTAAQAETERSVYTLRTINHRYAEWLRTQNCDLPEVSIRYTLQTAH